MDFQGSNRLEDIFELLTTYLAILLKYNNRNLKSSSSCLQVVLKVLALFAVTNKGSN